NNSKGAIVKRKSCRDRSRVRSRRVWTEKKLRYQAPVADAPREIPAARIKSAKWNEESVGRNVAVIAKKPTGAFPKIGNYHDVGLIISSAGLNPCLPLAHVVGCSQLCVPVAAADLQSPEFM